MQTSFDDHIAEMKHLGNILVPYNYPVVTIEAENEINVLKTREVMVDGYTLVLHYSKSFCEDHYLLTLQIVNKYSHFLPFSLVCKVAKRFLGEDLSLVETFQDNRKVYSWNYIQSLDGKFINPYESQEDEQKIYEGFKYRHMNPENVNFY